MEVDELLYRMGGVAAWRSLVAELPEAKVRAAVARGQIVRIARGRYALPGGDESVLAARRLCGALSHTSAALHHGWAVKSPPRLPHVMVPRHRTVTAHRRKGIHLHYGDVPTDGIVTTPVQTCLDCARTLPFDEALAVADSALRGGLEKSELMAAALAGPRTGRPAAVRVAEHADGRAANPFESVIRAISLEFRELRLVPQVTLPFGRPDLYDDRFGLVVECDSFQFHSARAAVVKDVQRYNDVALHRLTLLRFAWEHAMLRQDYVRETFAAWLAMRSPTDGMAVRSVRRDGVA